MRDFIIAECVLTDKRKCALSGGIWPFVSVRPAKKVTFGKDAVDASGEAINSVARRQWTSVPFGVPSRRSLRGLSRTRLYFSSKPLVFSEDPAAGIETNCGEATAFQASANSRVEKLIFMRSNNKICGEKAGTLRRSRGCQRKARKEEARIFLNLLARQIFCTGVSVCLF
jgi:hypothetical protein